MKRIESEEEMAHFAKTVLAKIQPKERAFVLALHGDLGAGKTTFTKKLAEALGVKESVVSPTFVIMKRYLTAHADFTTLLHIDAYRLESERDVASVRIEEYLNDPKTIVVIEWPEHIESLLPNDALHLHFSFVSDTVRTVSYDN